MKTEIVLRNENLWQRIQGFSLDAQNASFSFSKKLAKEENWTADFTKRAIEEYKKFVYLCCISPNGATPSEIVDKVWHMHLIYTQNYWEDFCPNVLKMNLHHHPSKGGFEENSKHQNWFLETLENYKEIFQQEAPDEIWKNNVIKHQRKSWFKKINFLPVIALFLTLFSCSESGSTGFFIVIFVIGVAFIILNIIGSFLPESPVKKKDENISNNSDGGSSCSGGGSGCSGGSCGGGCGGCGGS